MHVFILVVGILKMKIYIQYTCIFIYNYSILNPKSSKKGKKSANIWELEGEQEIYRDDKGCVFVIGFKME